MKDVKDMFDVVLKRHPEAGWMFDVLWPLVQLFDQVRAERDEARAERDTWKDESAKRGNILDRQIAITTALRSTLAAIREVLGPTPTRVFDEQQLVDQVKASVTDRHVARSTLAAIRGALGSTHVPDEQIADQVRTLVEQLNVWKREAEDRGTMVDRHIAVTAALRKELAALDVWKREAEDALAALAEKSRPASGSTDSTREEPKNCRTCKFAFSDRGIRRCGLFPPLGGATEQPKVDGGFTCGSWASMASPSLYFLGEAAEVERDLAAERDQAHADFVEAIEQRKSAERERDAWRLSDTAVRTDLANAQTELNKVATLLGEWCDGSHGVRPGMTAEAARQVVEEVERLRAERDAIREALSARLDRSVDEVTKPDWYDSGGPLGDCILSLIAQLESQLNAVTESRNEYKERFHAEEDKYDLRTRAALGTYSDNGRPAVACVRALAKECDRWKAEAESRVLRET